MLHMPNKWEFFKNSLKLMCQKWSHKRLFIYKAIENLFKNSQCDPFEVIWNVWWRINRLQKMSQYLWSPFKGWPNVLLGRDVKRKTLVYKKDSLKVSWHSEKYEQVIWKFSKLYSKVHPINLGSFFVKKTSICKLDMTNHLKKTSPKSSLSQTKLTESFPNLQKAC
jgi:hypothetical protein